MCIVPAIVHSESMFNPGFEAGQSQSWASQGATQPDAGGGDADDADSSHRPPNAFILYSNALRSSVRQENPTLSNTEVSRLLGKMWKEVPSEMKQIYKQRASQLQEEFKQEHPNYTYRKARRKRALNELLTKSSQSNPMIFPPGDQTMMAMYQAMQTGMFQQFPGQTPAFPQGIGQQHIPFIPQYPKPK
jgi:transcription factor SOX7/8/10/18 (SOX group E/F)